MLYLRLRLATRKSIGRFVEWMFKLLTGVDLFKLLGDYIAINGVCTVGYSDGDEGRYALTTWDLDGWLMIDDIQDRDRLFTIQRGWFFLYRHTIS